MTDASHPSRRQRHVELGPVPLQTRTSVLGSRRMLHSHLVVVGRGDALRTHHADRLASSRYRATAVQDGAVIRRSQMRRLVGRQFGQHLYRGGGGRVIAATAATATALVAHIVGPVLVVTHVKVVRPELGHAVRVPHPAGTACSSCQVRPGYLLQIDKEGIELEIVGCRVAV